MKKYHAEFYPTRLPWGHPEDRKSYAVKIVVPFFSKNYREAQAAAEELYKDYEVYVYEGWPEET